MQDPAPEKRHLLLLSDKRSLDRSAILDNFVPALRGLYQSRETPANIHAKVIEIARTDNRVIRDAELMAIVEAEADHAPEVVSSAMLACGERHLMKGKVMLQELLEHQSSTEIRLTAAIALLNLKPDKKLRGRLKTIISDSLAMQSSVEDRLTCLRTFEMSLSEKPSTTAVSRTATSRSFPKV